MAEPDISYPLWSIDTQHYWESCKREELVYQTCDDCESTVFHPRAACPYCLSDRLTWRPSAGRGSIYSFTLQHVPLHRERPGQLPRALGIIKLDEGYHMFAQIDASDLEALHIDQRVQVYFDRVAADLVLPKFRVADDEPSATSSPKKG